MDGGVNFCVYKKNTWVQVTPFAAMRFFSSGIGTSKTATFTLSEETSLWFSAYLNTNVSFKNLKGRFQLEKGSSSTAYEPYQSQSRTISLGSLELRKIGNYQDYIYKSGDDWHVHRETNKSAYSSSSGWNLGGLMMVIKGSMPANIQWLLEETSRYTLIISNKFLMNQRLNLLPQKNVL